MFRRISLKLISAVGLVIIIIISIFAISIVQSQREILLAEVERHTIELSEAVKNSSKNDMLQNNRKHIMESIKSIGEPDCILNVRILNKSGEIIYSADTTQVGRMVDKNAEACYACHAANEPLEKLPSDDHTRIFRLYPDSFRVMGVINPIYNERSCWDANCHAHSQDATVLGVLDIVVCLKSYEQSIAQVKMKILLFAIIVIISLSTLIWFLIRKLIDRPVKELVEATKTVASGNLNYMIQKTGNDELGVLGNSFNHMTQKLAEARTQLFQSDKMASLGQLAAGVAHEINNPLTGILTYSSFLLKRTKNNPDLQKDLSVIVHETKRSREIVKGLLDFARQSSPKKNSADVHEIINRAIGIINNQLNLKDIKLVKNFQGNLEPVKVDANQLQQVFINLIDNAAYAIGKGKGTITISTSIKEVVPYGNKQIKRATCPKGHNLIDPTIKIDGMPSIKVKASYSSNEGFINLHPIYGKHENRYGLDLKDDSELEISCPTCKTSLIVKNHRCPKCNSAIYCFETPVTGRFEGCSKKGCDWQQWLGVDEEGTKEFVEIKISDTGKGIGEEQLNKIFDPFYTTKGQEGTGLGLAVTWGIINNHNGTIKVTSRLCEGTEFIIMLPVIS